MPGRRCPQFTSPVLGVDGEPGTIIGHEPMVLANDGDRLIGQLGYVVLPCRDLEAMASFYGDVLGLPVRVDLGSWKEYDAGPILIALRSADRPYDTPRSASGGAGVQLAFRVSPEEVFRCHRALQEKGVHVIEGPKDQAWGHRTLFFRDPEGTLLEIYAEIGETP